MAQNSFAPSNGLGLPSGGLASRRGGQNIKPLSFDAMKASADNKDNGAPTPRTSRSHLLAGLRTAPKSATTGNFPASPTTAAPTGQQSYAGNGVSSTMYNGQQNAYAGPKTSLPRMPTQPQQQQQHYQQQQQQQAYQRQQQVMASHDHHYTAEQILAPPELVIDEQEQMDPNLYAQLVATNMYLAQQQQRLQQQLMSVQAAAQQFHGLSLNGQATLQQQVALQSLYQQQQQQLRSLQQSMANLQQPQQNMYTCYDPSTGQQMYYVDQNQSQYNQGSVYMDQPSTPQTFSFQQNNSTPRVQVSPPADNERPFFRSNTPPKKVEILTDHEPLPPPSANAFRRGHKKTPSMGASKGLMVNADEATKATGPKTASFPLTPASSGYGPGQARAGEHPLRQPRGPPSIEELRAKPTSKDEGSKNFVARTRRSAIHNLMKAGLERRKGTSSSGSMSPVSDTAEAATPLTDNESDSGRSGSGSLSGDAEPSLASSRTSASGSWGAIGSDRPSSRQKSRKSVDSISSASESDHGSFASVFKHGSHRASKPETSEGGRKARLVLTSGDKRKNGIVA